MGVLDSTYDLSISVIGTVSAQIQHCPPPPPPRKAEKSVLGLKWINGTVSDGPPLFWGCQIQWQCLLRTILRQENNVGL